MLQNHLKYIPNYASSFTGKERDSETGFSYFGARFYDSDLMTGWLSVDPMADKYPNISPYAYCAWNPVKLVDPDGRMIGDYYDRYGNYLGWDGHNDHNVYIITDKSSIEKIKNNKVTPVSDVKVAVSTNYFVLKKCKEVLDISIKNQGKNEFGMVMHGIFSSEIKQGNEQGLTLPALPKFGEGSTVSIHSHPDSDEKYNHYIEYMSIGVGKDATAFQFYDLNVIVGQRENQFEKGAAFYGRQPKSDYSRKEPILTISKTALSKMANGEISAILKRINLYE